MAARERERREELAARAAETWEETRFSGEGISRGEWLRLAELLAEAEEPVEPPMAAREFAALVRRLDAEEALLGSPAKRAGKGFGPLRAALAAAWIQARSLHAGFWLSAAAVMAMGLLLALACSLPLLLVTAALAPVLGGVSVCYAFRGGTGSMFEIEKTCAFSPLTLVGSRLAVVTGYDVALAVIALAAGGEKALWLGVLSWLGPLVLLSLLSLVLLLAGGESAALGGTLAVWGAQVVLRFFARFPSLLVMPGEPGWAAIQGLCLGGAAVCAALLVRLAERVNGPWSRCDGS